MTKVGFAGLGLMGSRMAKQLAAKGFSVTGWNRSAARAAGLGLPLAASPAELAAGADIVCTNVADPKALDRVLRAPDGVFAGAAPGTLILDFSTISPDFARQLDAEARARGLSFCDCPVTGSKKGAESASLLLMVGGAEVDLDRASPIFEAVGSKVIRCGPVGAGSQVKIAQNALLACMLQGICEGMLLSRKAGVDPAVFLDAIQSSGLRSPYFDFKAKAVLNRDFDLHFSIDLLHKDLGLFLESASENRVPTPLVAAAREVVGLARAAGKGEEDIGAIITVLEDVAGVKI